MLFCRLGLSWGLQFGQLVQQLQLEKVLLPRPPGRFGPAFVLLLVGLSVITVF